VLRVGSLKVGDVVRASVDQKRRADIMRNHSATHLLHAALRKIFGEHVVQKGSLVESERLRFDFSHNESLTHEQLKEIERLVNSKILNNDETQIHIMSLEKAKSSGAISLFGEKYEDTVRVLNIAGEFSCELCGGTHVRNTGDIGNFKIISQSSIAAGVRRVEALRDKQLQNYLKNKDKKSGETKEKNKLAVNELVEKIKELKGKPYLNQEKNQIDTIKDLNKQYEKLLVTSILDDKEKNIIKDVLVNKTKVRFQKVHELPFKDLRSLVDKGKKELNNGVVIVYAVKDDKIGLAVGVTQELSKKINAVGLVKIGSEIIGGKGGGGRADFAQAGGTDSSKIDTAFDQIKTLI